VIGALLRAARARRALVLATALIVAVAGSAALGRLTFDPDVLHLLPRTGTAVPAFREFLERFGSLDHLYVVFEAPEGRTIDEYAEAIDEFAAALAAAPEIARVDLGPADPSRDWTYLTDRVLLLLDDRTLADALDRFGPARLPAQIASTRELLALPSEEMTALVQRDPLGLLLLVRDRLSTAASGIQIDTRSGGYVTLDGRSRLVLARPRQPPFDTDFSKRLFDRLAAIEAEQARGAAADAADALEGRPPMRVRYAGGHAISLEIEKTVRWESIVNGVGSLALILPLLYFAFRSPWLVAVGAIPSALSILVVLAIDALLGRTLSAAATGAAAMQFGLGIDGVVLLFVAFRHLAAQGLSTEDAVPQLAGPTSSMLLGMWTTAATFYGLAVVDFPSLEELGVLIGHSMLLCGLVTMVLIPALLPRTARRHPPLTAWWLAHLVERHGRRLLVGAAVVTVVLGIAGLGLRVDPSLDRLRARTPGTEFEEEVARRFGVPQDVYLAVQEGPALEPLLEANEALVRVLGPGEGGHGMALQAPTMILPSARTQAARREVIAGRGLDAQPVSVRLRAAADTAGFRPGTFDPFLERLPRLLGPPALTYQGFRDHGLQDLLSRMIAKDGGRWTLVTYIYPGFDAEADLLRHAVRRVPGVRLTGVPEVNRELGTRFGPEFAKGLGAGTLLVVVLLVVTFRRADLTLLALVPTAIALVWAAGVLALAGIELDLFSVFAVMTFVGIGVDYGIHMVHRFARSRPDEGPTVIAHLAPVILVAAVTTLLGFGTLVTSSYPPLAALGVVSVVMIVVLAVTSLLVLPALLHRRSGR
jgi:predicted RND superfamily exporter protein